jgi:hypothetical protein
VLLNRGGDAVSCRRRPCQLQTLLADGLGLPGKALASDREFADFTTAADIP